jgi:hypothetical protein
MQARNLTRPAIYLALAGAASAPALVRSRALAEGPMTAREVKLNPERSGPGWVVKATGIPFAANPADIEIKAGPTRCSALEATPTYVRFAIPQDAKPGPLTIRFDVKGGERGLARFHVLTPEETLVFRKNAPTDGPDRPGSYDPDYLKIDSVVASVGTPTVCVVTGTTKLPGNMSITVKLGPGLEYEPPLRTTKLGITGTTWKATFTAAPGKVFPAGTFYAVADFEFKNQGASVGWPKDWDAGQRIARERIHAVKYATFGTPAEVERQTRERKAHYENLASRSTEAVETLERAYVAAGRSYFKKTGTTFDEDAWTKWARDRGAGASDLDLARLKKDERFLRGVYWNPDAWRQWLDKEFEKSLAAIWQNHVAMKAIYERSGDPLELEADVLVGTVLKHARAYTRELADWNHLATPDWSPDDLTGVPEAFDVTRGDFDRHKQALLARLAAATEKSALPDNDVKKGEKK